MTCMKPTNRKVIGSLGIAFTSHAFLKDPRSRFNVGEFTEPNGQFQRFKTGKLLMLRCAAHFCYFAVG